ncbi:hypothetical protein [Parabacteroides sp. FAFU027]|uniref:hypothetical protein n=1 Tax=Parabacteroides sp. FAFU027 TaxID=2922715 RepID=UPI001FB049A5|nr:hypothetical protein [Parabacteroides sp. FAFU027]
MKKNFFLRAITALLVCFCCLGTANAQSSDALFYVDFKTLPGAFTSGDIYTTSSSASQEKTVNNIVFGNGPSKQRINMNIGQSASQYGSGATSYVSETADDDGATAGAFSFLAVGTTTTPGGGYIITPEVQGPCKISVWNASGSTSSQQKFDVYFIENGGTPAFQTTTTIVANKLIKKNTYNYTGNGLLKVKFVSSSAISSANTNLYFYNILIESTAPATTPSLQLFSGANAQTVYPNQPISTITYKWGGTANAAAITWTGTASGSTAPDGITVTTDNTAKTVTVSGAPSTAGTYEYSVTATDGTNTTAALTGSITAKTTTKIKMAYVTTVTNGVPSTTDQPFLTALATDFDLNYISSTATGVDYSYYDVIMQSAVPSSGDAGLAELKTKCLAKPFVQMKTFQYQSSRWNWMTPANTSQTTIVVPDAMKSHPLFNGITFSGDASNEVILTTATTGNMAVKVTAWVGTPSPASPTVLATVKGETDPAYCYMEVPVGTTMSGMTATNQYKHMVLGLSEAAWGSLTNDAITLAVNAAKYVVSGVNVPTNVQSATAKSVLSKEYYDIFGRRVTCEPQGVLIEKVIYSDGSSEFKKIQFSK